MRRRLAAFILTTAAGTGLVAVVGGADQAWHYGQSVAPGSGSSAHRVYYTGPRDQGVMAEIDCGVGPAPTVHITVDAPGPDLRQIQFDVPVPVTVTVGVTVVHATGRLTEGVSPYVNHIRVSVGMQDAVAITRTLGRAPAPGPAGTYARVQIGATSARLLLAGASTAIAELTQRCRDWPIAEGNRLR
jgi:hypothetical protein